MSERERQVLAYLISEDIISWEYRDAIEAGLNYIDELEKENGELRQELEDETKWHQQQVEDMKNTEKQ